MKKGMLVGGLGLALLLLFPGLNLLEAAFSAKSIDAIDSHIDARFQAVGKIFASKCINCHSHETHYPWYFSLPFAKSVMQADIAAGLRRLEFSEQIFIDPKEVSLLPLARLEAVLNNGSMPPIQYKALHWNAGLSAADKQVIGEWINYVRALTNTDLEVAKEFAGEPLRPLPRNEAAALDPKIVQLGKRLFHDVMLSGDETISCATCHDLQKGGTDQEKFSTGIGGAVGDINSPTVFNSIFNVVQFWDGRAQDLQEQAAGPVENPIEMGATWSDVVQKLQDHEQYAEEFAALYPHEGISQNTITHAIATFEKTLITPNSRFDLYLLGKKDALSADELRGYELFKTTGCSQCHFGPAVGGTHFEIFGVHRSYITDRGAEGKADWGRFNVTGDEMDRYSFKVPILRNIAITPPYFHDGSEDSLHEAVKTMARYQLGKELSQENASLITKFLHTLTGEYDGTSLSLESAQR